MATPKECDHLVNQPVADLEFPVHSSADYQALRAAWGSFPRIPKIVDATTAPIIFDGDGQTIRLLLKGEESAGSMMACYVTMQPGCDGAPNHHQPHEDELWFCVQGTWEWTVGNKTQRVGPGAFVYAPRGTTHAFSNVGDDVAVMLTLNTPGGHERGFKEMSRLREEKAAPEQLSKRLLDHDFVFADTFKEVPEGFR